VLVAFAVVVDSAAGTARDNDDDTNDDGDNDNDNETDGIEWLAPPRGAVDQSR